MEDELTYERAIEVLRCDAQTGVLERKLMNGEWRICGNKPDASDGYGRVRIDGKDYLAHRVIWLLVHGEWPAHEVDHKNRNRIDNRIENLRSVSRAENNRNHGIQRNNSSGYPGVSFNKRLNKYMSRIGGGRKRIYLGLFDTKEEAYLAYQLAKIKYHPTSPISEQYRQELTLAGYINS